jgi:hypothetical protein
MTTKRERELIEEITKLRQAGNEMAFASMRIINDYDGVHRLALAISNWLKVIADEDGRGEKSKTTTN